MKIPTYLAGSYPWLKYIVLEFTKVKRIAFNFFLIWTDIKVLDQFWPVKIAETFSLREITQWR